MRGGEPSAKRDGGLHRRGASDLRGGSDGSNTERGGSIHGQQGRRGRRREHSRAAICEEGRVQRPRRGGGWELAGRAGAKCGGGGPLPRPGGGCSENGMGPAGGGCPPNQKG